MVGVIDLVVAAEAVHFGDHDDHQKDPIGTRDEMLVSSYQNDLGFHSPDTHNFDLAEVRLKSFIKKIFMRNKEKSILSQFSRSSLNLTYPNRNSNILFNGTLIV